MRERIFGSPKTRVAYSIYYVGITYRHFLTTIPWRLAVVHDASAASKGKTYSQEGIIVMLMPDFLNFDKKIHSVDGLTVDEQNFEGDGHILFAHSAKSKGISYSTSQ